MITQSSNMAGVFEEMGTQYATFFVNDLMFGLDVMQVQEILRNQQITPAPLSSPVIKGLINLRGQIITAIDLGKRLQLKRNGVVDDEMNVIVRTDRETVSLLVDRVGDVLEVTQDTFEDTPDNLSEELRPFVKGVHKLDGYLLVVLDIEAVTDLMEH